MHDEPPGEYRDPQMRPESYKTRPGRGISLSCALSLLACRNHCSKTMAFWPIFLLPRLRNSV